MSKRATVCPATTLDPLPDISGKIIHIKDAARHQAYWKLFRAMIAGLIEFIREERDKVTPQENADDVASSIVNELLDIEIPHSDLLGLALLRYAGAYLLFEEGFDREALVQAIKDI
jgi:hypothetical protein